MVHAKENFITMPLYVNQLEIAKFFLISLDLTIKASSFQCLATHFSINCLVGAVIASAIAEPEGLG